MMTQFELILALSLAGYLKGQWGLPKDARYSTVSVEFVEDSLNDWVESLPMALTQAVPVGGGKTVRRVRWEEESGDCDNIAWDFLAFMNRAMWHDSVVRGNKRGNFAGGSVFFQVAPGDPATGHAIAWFIDHDQKPHHVDPASFQIDHLTPAQLATIMGGEYA